MYAIAIEGDLKATGLTAVQVLKNLKDNKEDGRIEIASFSPGKGWVPVCIDRFIH